MIEFTKSFQNESTLTELNALYYAFLKGKADVIIPDVPKAPKDYISLILRLAVLDKLKEAAA